ncbi:MAG: deoxyribodipyrimidine photo-lyase [Pseudomonadota bacterium]
MKKPKIFWFRRDFRLHDHPGLTAILADGAPLVPIFILDPQTRELGAAHTWRLGKGLEVLADRLREVGSRLILRKGDVMSVLRALIAETGAAEVHWSRTYDPQGIARDTAVKSALEREGVRAQGHSGHVLFEPWTVETGQGSFYKVYTPFWNAVRTRDPGALLPAPTALPTPEAWPKSDMLSAWNLGAAMNRGAAVVARFARVGEAEAAHRLHQFVDTRIDTYTANRDRLDHDGTSGLSENLAFGEISPRQCWQAGMDARVRGAQGAETFLKELVWRDFAYHLLYHTPEITTRNWRAEWDGFPWAGPNPLATAWMQGRTGEPVIDAAMRQLYVTGTMHNRARMLVASYLTKHLMTDWRVGQNWFADCLIDWDPASNAMGWQWAAGSGPDAAPFFRIFNPATQAEKFDPNEGYRARFIAEGRKNPHADALLYFDAVPKSWGLRPDNTYPQPLVDLKAGREAALTAYKAHRANDAA